MGAPQPTEPTAPPVAPPEPASPPAPEGVGEPFTDAEITELRSGAALANVAKALEVIAQANPGVVTPDPEETPDPDPPVYDERGNVRPRGTPGAKPMTKAERVRIAARLRDGEQIVTTSERKPRKS